MKALEQGSEDTIAAINDLGDPDTQKLRIEYIRRDGKNIKNTPNPKNRAYFSDYNPKSLPYFWIKDRMERANKFSLL